jgi:glutaredoxin 3
MNSALRVDMRSRSGGRHTVPQIFIDNEHIGDCEELFRLENAGHLDRLLRVS